ncbi:MAG TPA: SDR family oxidoreductase [Acidimicrobiales bacterium]
MGMRLLVTGVDGYIGSVLTPKLLADGHEVVGVDSGFYRDGWLYTAGGAQWPRTHVMDIRHIGPELLEGVDAVVHLAELSNDPLGQLMPGLTHRINHGGSVRLAELAKAAGVERFVYTSSCSVYGAGGDHMRTEESETDPQTAYAECKTLVERDLKLMADDDFSPTFLRNATAYGPSPRMRFDIVLNNLSGFAWTTGVINMTSDGSPWRPIVHVADICDAIRAAVTAPREAVHNEVFNVGRNDANHRVREIAEIVAEAFPGCQLSIGSSDGDNRSYRVSFDKVTDSLPGFKATRDAALGARQLRTVFERIGMDQERFEWRGFTRLKSLNHLIATDQVDGELFWTGIGLGVDDAAEATA